MGGRRLKRIFAICFTVYSGQSRLTVEPLHQILEGVCFLLKGRICGTIAFLCRVLRHQRIFIVVICTGVAATQLLKQLRVNNGLLTLPFGFRREHGTMQRAGFLRLRAVSKIFQIRIGTAVFACAKVAVFAYGDRDDGVRLRKCSN